MIKKWYDNKIFAMPNHFFRKKAAQKKKHCLIFLYDEKLLFKKRKPRNRNI